MQKFVWKYLAPLKKWHGRNKKRHKNIKGVFNLYFQADILWARRRTEEISETQVPIKKIPFTFIDVGGQRTQREKWFQCFQESINSILFFVAISEFDQTLVEDRKSNRIIESLRVSLKYSFNRKNISKKCYKKQYCHVL